MPAPCTAQITPPSLPCWCVGKGLDDALPYPDPLCTEGEQQRHRLCTHTGTHVSAHQHMHLHSFSLCNRRKRQPAEETEDHQPCHPHRSTQRCSLHCQRERAGSSHCCRGSLGCLTHAQEMLLGCMARSKEDRRRSMLLFSRQCPAETLHPHVH